MLKEGVLIGDSEIGGIKVRGEKRAWEGDEVRGRKYNGVIGKEEKEKARSRKGGAEQ